MKKVTNIFVAFCCVMTMIAFSSCSWFVEGFEQDPNNPLDVPESLLLPGGQVSVGLVLGSDLTWYSSTFIRTQAGTARQMQSASNYDVIASDLNNPWSWAYADGLKDLQLLISKAELNGNPTYAGAGQVLTAVLLGVLTDAFGSVPYTQALQGDDGLLTPAYDSDSDNYATIQSLLDNAIANFAVGNDNLAPGGDDVMYAGDAALWTKAAWTLKARYANHMGNSSSALTFLENGFDTNAEDMQQPYGVADPNEANPWYQFNTQRGDLNMGDFFVDLLANLNDPRLPFYAGLDANGGYSGTNADEANVTASMLGPFYGSINSSMPIVTFAEAEFIRTECLMNSGASAGDIHAAFESAVRASCERTGVDPTEIDTYWTAIDPGAGNVTMEDIMTQKYIAMFTQFESWTDIRRTGVPAIPIVPGNSEIPARYPYPQREIDLNTTNVPLGADLFTPKIFWDN